MTLRDKIKRAAEYELDDHSSDWAKGIANEHTRLSKLIDKLCTIVQKQDESLLKIMCGLTTDQTKVEFYTKRIAYETRAEVEAILKELE